MWMDSIYYLLLYMQRSVPLLRLHYAGVIFTVGTAIKLAASSIFAKLFDQRSYVKDMAPA
jgi:hypothetical protein